MQTKKQALEKLVQSPKPPKSAELKIELRATERLQEACHKEHKADYCCVHHMSCLFLNMTHGEFLPPYFVRHTSHIINYDEFF